MHCIRSRAASSEGERVSHGISKNSVWKLEPLSETPDSPPAERGEVRAKKVPFVGAEKRKKRSPEKKKVFWCWPRGGAGGLFFPPLRPFIPSSSWVWCTKKRRDPAFPTSERRCLTARQEGKRIKKGVCGRGAGNGDTDFHPPAYVEKKGVRYIFVQCQKCVRSEPFGKKAVMGGAAKSEVNIQRHLNSHTTPALARFL